MLPDHRFFAFSHSGSAGNQFYLINGNRSGNLVRFLPDGTRDSTFKLAEELHPWIIRAVAVAPGGKFVAAGIAPDRNSRVVRLNADGSLDRSFDAGAGTSPTASGRSFVEAVAVDAAGRVLVGGQFGDFNGSGRANFLRLTPDGTVDTSFAPVRLRLDVNVSPGTGILTDRSIVIQPDGKILIGGFFSHVNEVPRLSVARFLEDGTLDPDFVPSGYDPARPTTTSSSKRPVNAIALQPQDGKVLIGGIFNPMSTQAQTVVRLNPDGSADATFTAPFASYPPPCLAVALLSDNKILTVDNVTVRRLQSNGSADTAFSSKAPYVSSGGLLSIAAHSDGKALFAGRITSFAGAQYSGVGRLAADGSLETAFRPGELQREHLADQIARRSDGQILISGGFDRVDGAPRAQLALLDSGGAVGNALDLEDVLWAPFYLLPDDKVMRWGYVPTGSPQFFVRRLHADGSRDTTFTAAPETIEFESLDLQPSRGYLLSTGSLLQAVAEGVLAARLKPDGSADESFDLGIDEARLVERDADALLTITEMWAGDNRALAILAGDRILYKYFDRDSNYKVVVLEADGAVDESFQVGSAAPHATRLSHPMIYDPVTGRTYQPREGVTLPTSLGPWVTVVDGEGSMILAGQFTSYNGQAAGGIVRVDANGSLQSTFGSGAALSASPANAGREPFINVIERDFAGRLLLAGDFDSFDGHSCPGLVRLNADGSVDTSFKAPVARRQTGLPLNSYSALTRQGPGRFLLSGNYAASEGSSTATSIFRLHIPVRTTGLMRTSANTLRLQFTGVPGQTYKLQTASTLVATSFQDADVVMQAAADGTFVYEDTTAFTSLQRFYRAVSLD